MFCALKTVIVLAAVGISSAKAEVVRIEVQAQRDWSQGQTFKAGDYESVSGTAWYEIDPQGVEARDITDIYLRPGTRVVGWNIMAPS